MSPMRSEGNTMIPTGKPRVLRPAEQASDGEPRHDGQWDRRSPSMMDIRINSLKSAATWARNQQKEALVVGDDARAQHWMRITSWLMRRAALLAAGADPDSVTLIPGVDFPTDAEQKS